MNKKNFIKRVLTKASNTICIGTLCYFFTITSTLAEKINVALEPLPPLITKEGKGLSIDMLRAMEKVSDIHFDISITPYNRAKQELQHGTKDLIGHTPYQIETQQFYAYAQELDWHIFVPIDVYAMKSANLEKQQLKQLQKIGTPHGNENFFSEHYQIPLQHFYTGDLKTILKMLEKGRLDIVLFERASTMSTIKELQIEHVLYRNIEHTPASFAVRNTPQGTTLKHLLNKLIQKLDDKTIFSEYYRYGLLPDTGTVSIDNNKK